MGVFRLDDLAGSHGLSGKSALILRLRLNRSQEPPFGSTHDDDAYARAPEPQDLESKNGTWVNGVRLEAPRALADGDELRVGMGTMTCRVHTRRDTSTISD